MKKTIGLLFVVATTMAVASKDIETNITNASNEGALAKLIKKVNKGT